jgi:hypothetical protein
VTDHRRIIIIGYLALATFAILARTSRGGPADGIYSNGVGVSPPALVTPVTDTVRQLSVVAGQGSDIHVAWQTHDDRVYYNGGRLGELWGTPGVPSRPLRIGRSSRRARHPSLAYSPSADLLSIVWSSETVPGYWDIRLSRWPGGLSAPYAPIPLTEDTTTGDVRPAVATHGDSTVAVWERHGEASGSSVYYVVWTMADSRPKAQPLSPIDGSSRQALPPKVAHGDLGPFWFVWNAESDAGWEVWLSRTGVSKSPGPADFAHSIRQGFGDDYCPDLVVDAAGRPHVVWQGGVDGGPIYYAHGLFDGGYTPVFTLTSPGVAGRHPRIAFLGDGHPRVCWQDVSTGATRVVSVVDGSAFGSSELLPAVWQGRGDIVWPRFYMSSFGTVLAGFVAPERATRVPAGWVVKYGETITGVVLSALGARPEGRGGVRLTWRSVGGATVWVFLSLGST